MSMTVREVRKRLQKIEREGGGDFEVDSEGCDCIGEVEGVFVYEHNRVIVSRTTEWGKKL